MEEDEDEYPTEFGRGAASKVKPRQIINFQSPNVTEISQSQSEDDKSEGSGRRRKQKN